MTSFPSCFQSISLNFSTAVPPIVFNASQRNDPIATIPSLIMVRTFMPTSFQSTSEFLKCSAAVFPIDFSASHRNDPIAFNPSTSLWNAFLPASAQSMPSHHSTAVAAISFIFSQRNDPTVPMPSPINCKAVLPTSGQSTDRNHSFMLPPIFFNASPICGAAAVMPSFKALKIDVASPIQSVLLRLSQIDKSSSFMLLRNCPVPSFILFGSSENHFFKASTAPGRLENNSFSPVPITPGSCFTMFPIIGSRLLKRKFFVVLNSAWSGS